MTAVSKKAAPVADLTLEQLRGLTAEEIANVIERDLSKWPGACFDIAMRLVAAFKWEGATAVYGHFCGKIAPTCKLFYGKPLVHHGWVLTADGSVVDPTRWVFEDVAPYIAIFKATDAEAADYDEGGERWARSKMGPAPSFQPSGKVVSLTDGKVPPELVHTVCGLLGTPRGLTEVSMNQVFWLANLPYTSLGTTAGPLYTWMKQMGVAGFVPIDFLQRARREGQLAA